MDYWTSVDGLYNTTLSLSFFVLAILMFYIGRKGYKAGLITDLWSGGSGLYYL
ncbi:MAG: hypothetical protein ACXACO_06990 [Promethearchaeota archaeon]|jgi:hypothetical protein